MNLIEHKALYRDFFEFYPPGGFLLIAAWVKFLGFSVTSFKIFSILCVAAIASLSYLACWRVSKRPILSAFLPLLWVELSQGDITAVNHHFITTALTLASFLAVDLQRPWAAAAAGLFAGAGGMVTQTRGALAAFASLVSLRGWRAWTSFALGMVLIPLGCLAYLASQGSLLAAWNDVIVWTATQYSGIQGVPFGHDTGLREAPLALGVPLTIIGALGIFAVDPTSRADSTARTAFSFAIAGLLGCFPRPDRWHIDFCVPLILPLTAFVVNWLARGLSTKRQLVVAALTISALIPSGYKYIWTARSIASSPRQVTPAGEAAFGDPRIGELSQAVHNIPKTEGVFFYPYMPLLPVLSQRNGVGGVDVFTPGYTTKQQYEAACLDMARDAKWVVFDRRWTDPAFLKEAFPRIKSESFADSAALEHVIRDSYAVRASFGPFDLLSRTKTPDSVMCSSR